MDIERIKRLRNVLSTIEANARHESSFDELYQLLQDEYHLEGGRDAKFFMGSYNHNLSQTIYKQADCYIRTKKRRPIKGAPSEFEEFISNFKQDVTDALGLYRFKDIPDTPIE